MTSWKLRLGSVFLIIVVALSLQAQDKPLPPSEAAARMTLPDGFQATLFAGEPDVVQPIGFTFDDRGRLWVAECYSYPKWIRDGKDGKDRVLIFEDTDNDGRFDKRAVFADKLANVSGIQVGFGGVWLCATPNLLFIPDENGDDKPDGPPEILLDGWSLNAKHNVFNGLQWGPDGWLYGCNGITDTSRVGKPGTPDKDRVPMNCGVWRYHPVRKEFEPYAWGTTNPWGLDWDAHGEMFITNCVIHHLWHVVQGAHYERMYGQDLNPHVYGLIKSCADHIHWGGGTWQNSRGGQGVHSEAGGGHAHVGCMVYLGDNWPDRYRNGVFMLNLHGSRVNHDLLERKGSGYVARHCRDFLFANDPWFRGLGIAYGPDGGVYISDWCDTGECHNYDKVHLSGRIYKVTCGKPKRHDIDLPGSSTRGLAQIAGYPNAWYERHARRLLHERAIEGGRVGEVVWDDLKGHLWDGMFPDSQLRAMWALHVTGGLSEKLLLPMFNAKDEHVRSWAVRLELEDRKVSEAVLDKLAEMAEKDPSPLVRLSLASGLQRLPTLERWHIATLLASHAEDADDAYLPLMIWYGVEPLVPDVQYVKQCLKLLARARIPLVRQYVARRLASLPEPIAGHPPHGLPLLVKMLKGDDAAWERDVLRGIQEALAGRRLVPMPKEWPAAYARLSESPLPEVRDRSLALAVLFGDEKAVVALRKIVADTKTPAHSRQNALQSLVFMQKPELVPLLHDLLTDAALRSPALRGLAAFNDATTPKAVLSHFATYTDDEKSDAVQTLASRPAYALALLDAVERGTVERRDVSAYTARQMLGLKDKQVSERLEKVWGAIRPASQEKAALTEKLKKQLTPNALKNADRSHGRLVYARTCAACHRLFDDGSAIGPDLTGSQRTNLDYMLENLLDPSALVGREYQVTIVATKNGRTITGIIKEETGRALTVQTQNEAIIVPKDEIEAREQSSVSMMPEGLLDKLTAQEVRDLIAYLAGPGQAPLPREAPKPK